MLGLWCYTLGASIVSSGAPSQAAYPITLTRSAQRIHKMLGAKAVGAQQLDSCGRLIGQKKKRPHELAARGPERVTGEVTQRFESGQYHAAIVRSTDLHQSPPRQFAVTATRAEGCVCV